ncbi:hypothetical protein OHA18_38060 [Kribbella sp. NBC_00709]|uniref:hypothetical protein n=1 Tax=Kribbella sp. NBC_00709 TaxID=2975972 RepID=UPI002E293D32|nr:hypothetical protein [Kribbella sp. NBC_00709]
MFKAIGMAAVLVAGSLLPGTATAAGNAVCGMGLGSVTAGGDHREQEIDSTVPPTAGVNNLVKAKVYAPGQVRVSSTMIWQADEFAGFIVEGGFVLIGDGLYRTAYSGTSTTTGDPGPRIGSGWGAFTVLEQSQYQGPKDAGVTRWNTYGLRNDGTLFRWTLSSKGAWQAKASAPGFAAVKSMVLISQTKTYDTFLANTRGGALYTIHIPTSAPMKPVVKQVRSSTWQGFETMAAQECGPYGVVLLGIDKDTDSAYLYAVGHANGTSTVIQSRGKVPASFSENVYFRWLVPNPPLNGE